MAIERKQTVIHLHGNTKPTSVSGITKGELLILHNTDGSVEFGTLNNAGDNLVWVSSADIATLKNHTGADVKVSTADTRTIAAAIASIEGTKHVDSLGGKTGAITLKATGSTNGTVNLTMNDNELQASIVGLGSAAYTNSTAYDAAGTAESKANAVKTALEGTTGDTSGSTTIAGAKKYADSVVAGKNVDATGDTLVSATASGNKVTVAATDTLKSAVTNANSAVQSVTVGSADTNYLSASTTNHAVTLDVKVGAVTGETATTGLAAANDVRTAINNLNTNIDNKVDKVDGKGLSTNDYTTAEKNKLAGIEEKAEVNIIETVKVNGTALTPDANRAVNVSVPVLGVKSGDNILTLNSDKTLSAAVSMSYSSTDKEIYLYGKDGKTVLSTIDTTDFIKDGMLSNAELKKASTTAPIDGNTSGTFLVLTWNTDAGDKVVNVNVTDLIDVYTAGTGIKVNGKEISIDTTTTATKAYVDSGDSATLTSAKTHANDLKTTIDAYTVNGKKISSNPVLGDTDIKMSTVTAPSSYEAPASGDTVNVAIAKLVKGIAEAKAAAGVTEFGEKTGAITVHAAADSDATGTVQFAMNGNQLTATVKGVDSTIAYKGSTADTASDATVAGAKKYADNVKTTVIGASGDSTGATTIYGAKNYAKSLVDNKNVTATGDTYVSATASENKVTVSATETLKSAVTNANSALQSIAGETGNTALISVSEKGSGTTQNVTSTDKLTYAVKSAETAVQNEIVANAVDNKISTKKDGTTVTWNFDSMVIDCGTF